MAYADSLRQQYATFTSAADLIDGVLSASTIFSAFSLGSTSAVAYVSQYGANANAAAINLQKSRNATIGSQTLVAANDEIGRINFAPSNGSSFQTAAAILAYVDGTPASSTDLPTGLVFYTTPDGSGTLTERMRIKNSGKVGIGTNNPSSKLNVTGLLAGLTTASATYPGTIQIDEQSITTLTNEGGLEFKGSTFGSGFGAKIVGFDDGTLVFAGRSNSATWTRTMSVLPSGQLLLTGTNTNPVGNNVAGTMISTDSSLGASVMGNPPLYLNRGTNDGDLVQFYQAGTLEGAISVAGNTITYGPFCGYHWSQLSDGTAPALEVGTVMDSINELCEWDGESEQRLPKAKVSDTVASPAVYGVFMRWDSDWAATNDMAVASVGAYFCRVAAGTVLAIGDLLESAGNGYAQKQADDIIRTRTIGKVTALTQSHIAADGSFCIPTVLYCG